MNNGFRIDTEVSRRQTLKEVKQAALRALAEYEADWHSIHFIQLSEHGTFRIECDGGDQFLLRIHSGNKPREAALSELEWLAALKSKNVALSEPVANRAGVFITDTATNDGQRFYATLLKWTEGNFLGRGEHTEESLRKIGAMMAKIHEASLDFKPSVGFSRHTWDIRSFRRDWEHLRAHRRSFISDQDFELYVAAFAKAIEQIETFGIDKQNYGIIHADLHIGNIVFQQGEPYPIDFGRCGFGYHLYDIAQATMGLEPPQVVFFMEGYTRIRKLEDDAFAKIESFLIIAIIEAYSFYAESGADTEMLIDDQPFAQAMLKAYLNGTPFLFEQPEFS